MKNLKISEVVHDELKVFAAKEKTPMIDIGNIAIVDYMKKCGHKFSIPPIKIKSSNTKNK